MFVEPAEDRVATLDARVPRIAAGYARDREIVEPGVVSDLRPPASGRVKSLLHTFDRGCHRAVILGTYALAVKHTCLAVSGKVRQMKLDAAAGETLAENLDRIMKARPELDSQPKIAAKAASAGVPIDQTTIGRALNYKPDKSTTLRTLDGLAAAIGLPAWVLLIPELDLTKAPANLEYEINRRVAIKFEPMAEMLNKLRVTDGQVAGPSVADPFVPFAPESAIQGDAAVAPKGRRKGRKT